MTHEDEVPRDEEMPVLVRLRESLPDAVGLIGFGLFARGLWVGFGEAVALSALRRDPDGPVCGFYYAR